jgi:hypothetical protein
METCKCRIIFVGLIAFRYQSMKVPKTIVPLPAFGLILLCFSSCSLFGPKYGCPSDGKNVGAERILSGEKVHKAPRFKA